MRLERKLNGSVELLMRLRIASIALLALFFASCKPVHQTLTQNSDRYESNDSSRHTIDSVFVYMHDSVSVFVKGDTIREYKERTKYIDRLKIDSLYVHDTLIDIDTVTTYVDVPAKITPLQQRAIASGYILWMLLLVLLGIIIYKIVKNSKKQNNG